MNALVNQIKAKVHQIKLGFSQIAHL